VDCAARHIAEPIIAALISRVEMYHFPAWPRLEIEHALVGPTDMAKCSKATDANTKSRDRLDRFDAASSTFAALSSAVTNPSGRRICSAVRTLP
jgi:hypothetical protein